MLNPPEQWCARFYFHGQTYLDFRVPLQIFDDVDFWNTKRFPYPRILRQISVLRYEMEHPAHVSAQEMLDAMTYACGDRTGSSPGHVSDKTFYIAMNYRQKAAAANSEISEEISAKLLELERKKGRIEYYVGMLDSRKANVIRLCFFEGRTIEDAAEELNISAKTAQIAKKKAIEDLTDLFALTSNIN